MIPRALISCLFVVISLLLTISKGFSSEFTMDPLGLFGFKNKTLQDRIVSDAQSLPQDIDIVLAYDFTSSNAQMGINSFGGKSLHHLFDKEDVRHNPYQVVTKLILANLLSDESEKEFRVLGFGDEASIASFDGVRILKRKKKKPIVGLYRVLKVYRSYRKKTIMSGPTSFAGPIRIASQQAAENKRHTLLIIITDGALSPGLAQQETFEALASASSNPLSVLIIGVGDGTERERKGSFPGLEVFKSLKDDAVDRTGITGGINGQLNFDNVDFVNANDFLGGAHAVNEASTRLELFLRRCAEKVVLQREFMEKHNMIEGLSWDERRSGV